MAEKVENKNSVSESAKETKKPVAKKATAEKVAAPKKEKVATEKVEKTEKKPAAKKAETAKQPEKTEKKATVSKKQPEKPEKEKEVAATVAEPAAKKAETAKQPEKAVAKKQPEKQPEKPEKAVAKKQPEKQPEKPEKPLYIDGRFVHEKKFEEKPKKGTAPYELTNKKIKITLVRSTNGCLIKQKRTIEALNLRKIRQSVVVFDNAAIRGMIFRVRHLVTVEDVK